MFTFELFRGLAPFPLQASLLLEGKTPATLITEAIEQSSQVAIREGKRRHWRMGAVERLEGGGLHFLLGRATRDTLTLYDEVAHDFTRMEFDNYPVTHVIYDPEFALFGIARQPRLAKRPVTIAAHLRRLLAQAPIILDTRVSLAVNEISDPKRFVEYLKSAHSIRSFSITFGGPNPPESEELFTQPMSRLLQKTGGTEGSARVKGLQLNSEFLQELAESAAATGQNASAKIVAYRSGKPVTRYLRGAAVGIPIDSLATPDDRRNVVRRLRQMFQEMVHR